MATYKAIDCFVSASDDADDEEFQDKVIDEDSQDDDSESQEYDQDEKDEDV